MLMVPNFSGGIETVDKKHPPEFSVSRVMLEPCVYRIQVTEITFRTVLFSLNGYETCFLTLTEVDLQ